MNLNHVGFVCTHNQGGLYHDFLPVHAPYQLTILVNNQPYITIYIPPDFIHLCIFPAIEPLGCDQLGDDIIANILEITLANYIEQYEKNFGLKISFRVSKTEKMSQDFYTQCVFTDKKTQIKYPFYVCADEDYLKDFLDKFYLKAQNHKTLQPSISLSVVCAVKQFPLRKISRLNHGEIIIIMTNRHLINQPLGIIGQRLVIETSLSGQQLTIKSDAQNIENIAEFYMNQGDVSQDINYGTTESGEHSSIADNIAASMTDMRVSVTFELGRVDIPVNFLSKISSGQVIDLAKPLDENVSVIVNGKVIALGEVVQVGRNFGVIIKEVV
jgi:flagellar motor switch protein FliN